MNIQETVQPSVPAVESAADTKIQEAVSKYLPKIRQTFQEKIKPGALAAAGNDELLRPVCSLVYGTLPFPVRLFVKEDAFVQFRLNNRDKLAQPASPAVA